MATPTKVTELAAIFGGQGSKFKSKKIRKTSAKQKKHDHLLKTMQSLKAVDDGDKNLYALQLSSDNLYEYNLRKSPISSQNDDGSPYTFKPNNESPLPQIFKLRPGDKTPRGFEEKAVTNSLDFPDLHLVSSIDKSAINGDIINNNNSNIPINNNNNIPTNNNNNKPPPIATDTNLLQSRGPGQVNLENVRLRKVKTPIKSSNNDDSGLPHVILNHVVSDDITDNTTPKSTSMKLKSFADDINSDNIIALKNMPQQQTLNMGTVVNAPKNDPTYRERTYSGGTNGSESTELDDVSSVADSNNSNNNSNTSNTIHQKQQPSLPPNNAKMNMTRASNSFIIKIDNVSDENDDTDNPDEVPMIGAIAIRKRDTMERIKLSDYKAKVAAESQAQNELMMIEFEEQGGSEYCPSDSDEDERMRKAGMVSSGASGTGDHSSSNDGNESEYSFSSDNDNDIDETQPFTKKAVLEPLGDDMDDLTQNNDNDINDAANDPKTDESLKETDANDTDIDIDADNFLDVDDILADYSADSEAETDAETTPPPQPPKVKTVTFGTINMTKKKSVKWKSQMQTVEVDYDCFNESDHKPPTDDDDDDESTQFSDFSDDVYKNNMSSTDSADYDSDDVYNTNKTSVHQRNKSKNKKKKTFPSISLNTNESRDNFDNEYLLKANAQPTVIGTLNSTITPKFAKKEKKNQPKRSQTATAARTFDYNFDNFGMSKDAPLVIGRLTTPKFKKRPPSAKAKDIFTSPMIAPTSKEQKRISDLFDLSDLTMDDPKLGAQMGDEDMIPEGDEEEYVSSEDASNWSRLSRSDMSDGSYSNGSYSDYTHSDSDGERNNENNNEKKTEKDGDNDDGKLSKPKEFFGAGNVASSLPVTPDSPMFTAPPHKLANSMQIFTELKLKNKDEKVEIMDAVKEEKKDIAIAKDMPMIGNPAFAVARSMSEYSMNETEFKEFKEQRNEDIAGAIMDMFDDSGSMFSGQGWNDQNNDVVSGSDSELPPQPMDCPQPNTKGPMSGSDDDGIVYDEHDEMAEGTEPSSSDEDEDDDDDDDEDDYEDDDDEEPQVTEQPLNDVDALVEVDDDDDDDEYYEDQYEDEDDDDDDDDEFKSDSEEEDTMTIMDLLTDFKLGANDHAKLHAYFINTLGVTFAKELVNFSPDKVKKPEGFTRTKTTMLLSKMAKFVTNQVLHNYWKGEKDDEWVQLETNTLTYTFAPAKPVKSHAKQLSLEDLSSVDDQECEVPSIFFENQDKNDENASDNNKKKKLSNRVRMVGHHRQSVARKVEVGDTFSVIVLIEGMPNANSTKSNLISIGVVFGNGDKIYVTDRLCVYKNNQYIKNISSTIMDTQSEICISIKNTCNPPTVSFVHRRKGINNPSDGSWVNEFKMDGVNQNKNGSFAKMFVEQHSGEGIYALRPFKI